METTRLNCAKCKGQQQIEVVGQIQVSSHTIDKGICHGCRHYFLISPKEPIFMSRNNKDFGRLIDMLNEDDT